jgi:hypothetical protein
VIKKIAIASVLFFGFMATASATTFDVSLDGFCNTFTLTISGFEVYGTRQGCGYTVIDGGALVTISGSRYRMTADTNDGSTLFTWFFTPPKNHKGNWYLYGTDGTTDTLINSGTYTRTGAAGAAHNNGKRDITAGFTKRH